LSYCEKCREDWRREKLNRAIIEAQNVANETGQTQAIIKNGCIYQIIKATDATEAIRYISSQNL